jgi:TonB family protein
MAFLQNKLLVVVALLSLAGQEGSMRVQRVEPPAHPVNTVATGLVVVEIYIERTTGEIQTRMLHGESPFALSALEALKQWRFVAPPEPDIGRTSVTFLFRPPSIYSVKIGATAIWPWDPSLDFPALPQEIIDPGYPPTSLSTGAAILEVRVNASGAVISISPVGGITPLTDQAQEAVKNWKFSPAKISGKAAPSTVFVVISFVLPT